MILTCPYCGHYLPHPLENGISSCVNCCRIFDSCKKNYLLSTAWLIRKRHINDSQYLIEQLGVSEEDAVLLINFVCDKCFSHEDLSSFLEEKFLFKNCLKAS